MKTLSTILATILLLLGTLSFAESKDMKCELYIVKLDAMHSIDNALKIGEVSARAGEAADLLIDGEAVGLPFIAALTSDGTEMKYRIFQKGRFIDAGGLMFGNDMLAYREIDKIKVKSESFDQAYFHCWTQKPSL